MESKATVLVIGGTVEGIAAAVRAAREGLDTLLVTYQNHLGGVFPSLGAIETHYAGIRTPFLEELKQRIIAAYRVAYGENSPEYRVCISIDKDSPFITFEPHVAERVLAEIANAEPRLRILRRYYPVAVERTGDTLDAVAFRSFDPEPDWRVHARIFIDATYEGDLAALAGVPYRIGRESRAAYDEPHAGQMFTRIIHGIFPNDAATGKLRILPKNWATGEVLAGSTGEGDNNIQSYSYRLCLSCEPKNRRLPAEPAGYDRTRYLALVEDVESKATKRYALHHRFLVNSLRAMIAQDHIFHGHALPNNKRSWNATNFTEAAKEYPDAQWDKRNDIAKRHIDHALGLMYFMQNDSQVPDDIRASARDWGLALDEFSDNGNIPEQMYIREARRIGGRYVFTEQDAQLAPGIERAPIHADSIAITEFPLDSLACTMERSQGSLCDGQFFLAVSSRPGQVPFRIILPEHVNNLMVTVAASASHVAWGTIRQSATLIQIAEVAGIAAALAIQENVGPGSLSYDRLQQSIVESGIMLTFFNDFDMGTHAPWVAAVQYLGTKGFFPTYDARPQAALSAQTALRWAQITGELMSASPSDPLVQARQVYQDQASQADGRPATAAEFVEYLDTEIKKHNLAAVDLPAAVALLNIEAAAVISRGEACRLVYALLRVR